MKTVTREHDRAFYDLLFYIAVLFALIFVYGCASKNKETLGHSPLLEQRLQFRPGFEGLTSQTCGQYQGEKCQKMDTLVYDLRDPDIRRQLIEVKLVCNVGGSRYRVCKETKGLCRQTVVRSGFLGLSKEIKLVDVKLQERDFQSLLNLNTWCAAQDSFLGQAMFSGDLQ